MNSAPARARALAPSYTTVNVFTQCAGWLPVGWDTAEAATNRAFSSTEDFGRLFGAVLDDAVEAGFGVIDLWLAHLNPAWSTREQEEIALQLIDERSLVVNSLSGPLGSSAQELGEIVALAERLGVVYLAGPCDAAYSDRPGVLDVMRDTEVVLALENHPRESSIDDMLRLIGDEGVLATTVDTGWWMTVGVNPGDAIERLGTSMVCFHAKDIRAVGAHDNVPWGEGIVDVRSAVELAIAGGYSGAITIEFEPEFGDPRWAFPAMREMLGRWIASAGSDRLERGPR